MSDFIFDNAADIFRVSLWAASALGLTIWGLVARMMLNRWRESAKAERSKPAGRFSELQDAIRRAEEGARTQ